MRNNNFIITQDSKTKEELLRQGFELISKNDNTFIFLNCVSKFEKINKVKNLKFTFSNFMTI